MPTDYLTRILNARVYDVAIESPLTLAPGLSRRLGHQVWVKREDLQPVFSFKLRGACNRIAKLPPAELRREGDAAQRHLRRGPRSPTAIFVAVTIPERPGSFKRFCSAVGPRNITEFNYRMFDPTHAHVFAGLEVRGRTETTRVVRALRRHGFAALDLSENEMAKLHVRHLVGGHASLAGHELLFRFEFPERPGALLRFLTAMRSDWNISLFHYCNHGADNGRVLVGMQVPPGEMAAFRTFLKGLGYPFVDETNNPAYRLFLG